ncbi:MAG: hypothetical protein IPP53_14350 [Bacteroidetes bacterium]|nr:hypothetical protein [Bacteroidota bacterium]
MKPILFAFSMAFIFASCKKDIKLMDKRNDCKDCVLTYLNYQGDIYTKLISGISCQIPFYNFAKQSDNTVECN